MDGQWYLYDPVWSLKGTTDRQFIAEHYFTDRVGGITPIYDENNMPPFSDPESVFAYMNGKYTLLKNGEISDIGGAGFWLNMAYNLTVEKHTSNSGLYYLDAPAYVYEGLEENELFSNGWIAYGEPFNSTQVMHYVYENGIMASEIVINRNGVDYYMDQGLAYKICMPQDVYTMRYGQIKIQTGYQGKIWELSEEMLAGGTCEFTWSTDDPTVATIDQNGVVTSLKPGMVSIQCQISGESTLPGVDLVVGDVIEWTVYFWDESPRPDEFAALDPGGPAGITIHSDGLGPRGITPIITTPEVWGDETPAEGIEFGYTMIPTDLMGMDYMDGSKVANITPENGVLTLPIQLKSPFPEVPDTSVVYIWKDAVQLIQDQNCSLEIPLATGTMLLDEVTVAQIQPANDEDVAELWLIPMEIEWCDYGQQPWLQRMATAGIYNIHCEVGISEIHDLQGGTATVTVPLNESGGTYGVYFVDAYGNFTEVASTVNGDGTITFVAPYFATYAVINTAKTPVT